jgi:dynein light chain LC8-type
MAARGGAAAAAAAAPASAPVTDPLVVLHSDCPGEVLEYGVKKAREALGAHKAEKDQATAIKKALEAAYGGLYHVVVGGAFGLSVTHEANNLALFRLGRANVLFFQTFDEASLVRAGGAAGAAGGAAGAAGRRAAEAEAKKEEEDE